MERPDLLSPVRKDTPSTSPQIYIGAFIVGGRVKKANLVELPTTVRIEALGSYGSFIMRWDYLVEHVQNWSITTPTTITPPVED